MALSEVCGSITGRSVVAIKEVRNQRPHTEKGKVVTSEASRSVELTVKSQWLPALSRVFLYQICVFPSLEKPSSDKRNGRRQSHTRGE